MSIEDRLRTALHDEADGTHVDPASFDRIERRTAMARRRRRAMGGGLALVALVAVAVGGGLALQDDGEPVRTGAASDTQDTVATTSTTTDETNTDARDYGVLLWPAVASDRSFASAEAAAAAFADEYLGIIDPGTSVAGPSQEGDGAPTARIAVRPRAESGAPAPPQGPMTVVDLVQATVAPRSDPSWFVHWATSPHLTVTQPALGATVSSSVHVEGLAGNLFEGNVIVELRDETGSLITRTNTTATGSGPEMAPFSVDVDFRWRGRGAVVVMSDSGIEGVPEATVVPVTFASPVSDLVTEVTVYLQDPQGDFVPVTREVPRTTGVLRAALEELLQGATPAEEQRGLRSPFSLDRDIDRDLLGGVTISGDGTAIVDFEPGIVDALGGADGAAVLASLDHTVFQFPTVTWVRYSVGGQCTDIAGIGTDLLCERRSRDEY